MATQRKLVDVEKFLDDHPQFAESYFVRKATEETVMKWNERRFLLSNNGERLKADKKDAPLPYHRPPLASSIIEDQEMSFEEDDQVFDSSRRHSEPHHTNITMPTKSMVRRASDSVPASLPTIATENNWRLSLAEQPRRPRSSSLELGVHWGLGDKHHSFSDAQCSSPLAKHSLRKSQSFPICRNSLANLINSSAIPPESVSLDWRQVQRLKTIDRTVFLHELMYDITQELNLNMLTAKLSSNIGLIADCSHVEIVYIKDQRVVKPKTDHIAAAGTVLTQDNNNCTHQLSSLEDIKQLAITHVMETKQSFVQSRPCVNEEKSQCASLVIYKPITAPSSEMVGITCLTYDDHSDAVETENQMLDLYLNFCGVIITNAQLFTLSAKEFNRNKALLELAKDIFENQTSLDKMLQKMTTKALELLKANQCSILLLKQTSGSTIPHGRIEKKRKGTDSRKQFSHGTTIKSKEAIRRQWHVDDSMETSKDEDPAVDSVASFVAETGQVYNSRRFSKEMEMLRSDFCVTKVETTALSRVPSLSMAIRKTDQEIIGVVKLEGRSSGDEHFDDDDERILEAFTIFCGLGINNSILYDKVSRAKAQQQVALEVLSYHTNARQIEADKLKLSPIPAASILHLTDFKFDDFSLSDDQMLTASVRMFIDCGFVSKYQMEYETLCKWLLTVRKNYRRVIYHNWRHAFNVAQSMFACMKTGKLFSVLSGNECLGLMVGCLCHDLDHRGTNNEFQMKSDSALALLYGTSTMEHHHFNHAVMILNSEGNDIFKHLSSEAYASVMKYMRQAILATDLAQYFANRTKFSALVEDNEFDSKVSSHRLLLRNMLMTACDLNGITKPWDIQKKVVHLVTSEFFHQGDLERDTLNVEPGAMMDRNNILDLPKMQVNFFHKTGVPVYEVLLKVSSKLLPLYTGSVENLKRWRELSEQVDQGHVDPELEPVLIPLTPVDVSYD